MKNLDIQSNLEIIDLDSNIPNTQEKQVLSLCTKYNLGIHTNHLCIHHTWEMHVESLNIQSSLGTFVEGSNTLGIQEICVWCFCTKSSLGMHIEYFDIHYNKEVYEEDLGIQCTLDVHRDDLDSIHNLEMSAWSLCILGNLGTFV